MLYIVQYGPTVQNGRLTSRYSESRNFYPWTFLIDLFLSIDRAQQKRSRWRGFSTSLKFQPPVFKNAARYPNSETIVQCRNGRPMFSPSLVKLGPCVDPWEFSVSGAPPLQLQRKTCYIVNNSAMEYLISLKFCMEFKCIICEVLWKFKRWKVNVTARHNTCKNSQNYQ